MRIASLLPAATEWVAALGATDLLVARSHECDFPPEITELPVVTASTVPEGGTLSIDRAVPATLERGLSVFEVDLHTLRTLRPTLILTQAQGDVCAISTAQLERMLAGEFEPAPEIFAFEPRSMKDVLDHVLRLARRLDRAGEAMAFVAEQEKRLRQLQDRIGIKKKGAEHERPTVCCVEWLDPLVTSGNWVPDLVFLAGGRSVCANAAERSRIVEWDAIVDADPDFLAVMPRGFAIAESKNELQLLSERPGWKNLKAVQNDRVYLFDGQAFFNRPGPRLYRSIELLASMMHAEIPTPAPLSWEVQQVKTASQFAG